VDAYAVEVIHSGITIGRERICQATKYNFVPNFQLILHNKIAQS